MLEVSSRYGPFKNLYRMNMSLWNLWETERLNYLRH